MSIEPSKTYKARYGGWAGFPQGHTPDFTLCCEEVYPNERGGFAHRHQCQRKRGFGPESAYCKQHDPEATARRAKEANERSQAQHRTRMLEWGGPRFFAALEKIANGHNDPRSLAQETIASYLPAPLSKGTP